MSSSYWCNLLHEVYFKVETHNIPIIIRHIKMSITNHANSISCISLTWNGLCWKYLGLGVFWALECFHIYNYMSCRQDLHFNKNPIIFHTYVKHKYGRWSHIIFLLSLWMKKNMMIQNFSLIVSPCVLVICMTLDFVYLHFEWSNCLILIHVCQYCPWVWNGAF